MKSSTEVNKIVGANVKKARNSLGLTQEEFAKSISCSPILISMIERGKRSLSMESAELIEKKHGIRKAYLLGFDGYMTEADRIAVIEKQLDTIEVRFDDFISLIADRLGFDMSNRKNIFDPIVFTKRKDDKAPLYQTTLSSDILDSFEREIIDFAEYRLSNEIRKQRSADLLNQAVVKEMKKEEK